ncbi:MAG: IPT/TIG domain-containing protein, partial [Verrucomicrobiae bacterium]|nr:IPT/TIG domain-containing protein [Verrucomicrobiae bacterium]
ISGAVAADDPWLVSGYDVGRFRFKVATSTLESMTLQANGLEGRIDLSWMQDDYDLLAGYNLYRSDNPDGEWTRLNRTIIPKGQESYVDMDVAPAVRMYYRFTVMTTDSVESEPSEIVSAAAADTLPPVLMHTPVVAAVAGRGLRLTATVTDNVQVTGVGLRYRSAGGADPYIAAAMLNASGNLWSATIPASSVQPPGLEYYLSASDGLNEVLSGTAATPHTVLVENQPALSSVTPNHGPAGGGTPVTLAGIQFQSDASVWFGAEAAAEVTLVSANQITCVTPGHIPAQVDVKVLNPDGSQAVLLNGFRFEASGLTLALPSVTGDHGTVVELPLSAGNAAGLRAAEVILAFDPTVLTPVDARVGTLVADWSLAANLNVPGQLRLTLAGSEPAGGSGALAMLRFEVVGVSPASTALTIQAATLNDGALTGQFSHGQFAVNGNWQMTGTVTYFQDARPVPGVGLDLIGAGTHTADTGGDGSFLLTDLPTASYTLLPAKDDDISGITAYDASLVLQSAAGTLSLSAHQTLAADVNRNGLVSAMDASYLLEASVGLLTPPFPGAGQVWDFDPAQRSYALFSGDQSGQDFTAVLIGDVSGNWGVPMGVAGGSPEADPVVLSVRRADGSADGTSHWWLLARVPGAGLHSLDLELTLEESPENGLAVQPGPLAAALAVVSNNQSSGRLRVGMAGAQAVHGLGALLQVTADEAVTGALRVASASIDEGRVAVRVDVSGAGFDRDTDGDHQSDWHEVLSGTDPGDRGSVLAVRRAIPRSDGSVVIEWAAVPGRRYQVQFNRTVSASGWRDVGSATAAQTDVCS